MSEARNSVVEIFRTGTHKSSSGTVLSFSETDILATKLAYDAASCRAPLCIGHPIDDKPAFGTVEALLVKGDRLLAVVKPEQSLIQLVRSKKVRGISASFMSPYSPENPAQGAYSLRHVGFLIAENPALKSLKYPDFCEAQSRALKFSEVIGLSAGFMNFSEEECDDKELQILAGAKRLQADFSEFNLIEAISISRTFSLR